MEDYYDIDAILAEQQRLPLIFKIHAEGLGYLDGSEEPDLPENTRIELPFWLVKQLAQHREWFEVEIPKCYGSKVRSSLRACSTNVNFHTLNPYYYLYGLLLVDLLEDVDLNMVLADAFKARIQLIMDYTQTVQSRVQTEFLTILDETEKELYKIGAVSQATLRKWNNRTLFRLNTAEVLQIHGKSTF
ncbi:DNA replication protein [Basidiobolus ranarum]|uniref:DNA replication complex GINS protein PSF3 n=1 Tax=Basidiobolus ranarum TaxID=34480 RepID=A0ABR2X2T9_9FUNG